MFEQTAAAGNTLVESLSQVAWRDGSDRHGVP